MTSNMDTVAKNGNHESPSQRAAGDLLEAALAFPSLLTGPLVEEAARVLERGAEPLDGLRISEARKTVGLLESLRAVLRQERAAVAAGARWIGGDAWHLERREDGDLTILGREWLGGFAREAGIGESSLENLLEGNIFPSTHGPEARAPLLLAAGLPAGWSLRALLDGVDVQGFPLIPGNVMASVSSGPWRIDAVCRDPEQAFAGLDAQRGRQRTLIGGTAAFLSAALAGFLWVLQRQRRLNAMMSNFVAAVSHELRAPMASMGLLAERLNAGKVTGDAEQACYHGLIEGECRRISATIENVLAFSRMERQQPGREFELSDLRALVADAAGVFKAPAAGRKVTLETQLPEEAMEMEVDPVSLRQALINLLDNAIKFSPPGGRVRIRLEAEATSGAETRTGSRIRRNAEKIMRGLEKTGAMEETPAAIIIVSDEGPGVPSEARVLIFDAFYRPGSELRRGTQGIGLGLAIVRECARAHGGDVKVRNLSSFAPVSRVTGAEFTLRLVNQPAASH